MHGGLMPILQVRDVPEDLYETLSKVAKEDNRSIFTGNYCFIENSPEFEAGKNSQT